VRLGQFDIPGRIEANAFDVDRRDESLVNFDPDPEEAFYGVKRAIIHRQYDPPSHLHDIAILRLDRLVRFTANIQRICLPPPSIHPLDGQHAFVAG